jgi:hypothetical protein
MGIFTRSKKKTPATPSATHAQASACNGQIASVPPPVRDLGSPLPAIDPALEQSIQSIGRELLDAARKYKSGFLSSAFRSDKLMDWASRCNCSASLTPSPCSRPPIRFTNI